MAVNATHLYFAPTGTQVAPLLARLVSGVSAEEAARTGSLLRVAGTGSPNGGAEHLAQVRLAAGPVHADRQRKR